MKQQLFFESDVEKGNVTATLTRLINEITERSHTTGELDNLRKALFCVGATPVEEETT